MHTLDVPDISKEELKTLRLADDVVREKILYFQSETIIEEKKNSNQNAYWHR